MNLAQVDRLQIWTEWNHLCQTTWVQKRNTSSVLGVLTLDSGREGVHIGISGSIHGNEPVGACALLRLWERHQKHPLIDSGKLSLIFGNPQAFLKNVRFVDEDLNRAFISFPDHQSQKSLEAKRVGELRSFLDEHPLDFLLDLHTISRGDYGIVVYPQECKKEAHLLGNLGVHFCYELQHMAGRTLIDEVVSRRGKAIVIECGHHHSAQALDVALVHTERVLRYFDLFQGHPLSSLTLSPSTIIQYQSQKMIQPGSEFVFTSPVETGSYIPANTVFAQDQNGPRTYPHDMWLMMPSLHVSPHDSDAGWICSRTEFPNLEF